jgi:hypothetical protein
MQRKMLLCELHAHTTWSDGALTLTELVDLYGRHAFDVLCVTDHVAPGATGRLTAATHTRYVTAIEREARRAREQYGLLLIPGLELTFHDGVPRQSGHALALSLRSWIGLDRGLEHALHEARAAGAATVAAHPHGENDDPNPERTTRWFWHNRSRLRGLVDRCELINRHQTFGWIADQHLHGVASGDFHRVEHLETWKTQLPCAKSEAAVVAYLRSRAPAYIVPWHLRNASRRRRAA